MPPPVAQTCRFAALAGALGLLFSGLCPADAQQIGTAGAVNPATTGTPPNAASRMIAVGREIVDKERIVTSSNGSAQIIFTDTSTMNIGRDSQVVIDRYVYDPANSSGTQAISLGKGVLRFVGGQVSHSQGMSVATPVATIGVRGGTGTVGFADCGVAIIDQSGVLRIANRVSQVTIRRPDYYVCVAANDAPIGEPRPVPPGLLARFAALLSSGKGQKGGATTLPTDAGLLEAGLGLGNLPSNPGLPNGTPGLGLVGIPLGGDTIVRGATPGDHVGGRLGGNGQEPVGQPGYGAPGQVGQLPLTNLNFLDVFILNNANSFVP